MNTMLFKSAYDKVRLSEEFKAMAKKRLKEYSESHHASLADTDTGEARTYTVIGKNNSAWKMMLGLGALAAAVAVAVVIGVCSVDNTPIETSLSPLASDNGVSQSVQADEDTRQAIKNVISVALTKLDTLRSGMRYGSNEEQILYITVDNGTWSCSAADPDNFSESDSMTWGIAGTANASTQKEDIKNGESFLCYELCSLMPHLKNASIQITLCSGRCTSVVFTEGVNSAHNDDIEGEIWAPQLSNAEFTPLDTVTKNGIPIKSTSGYSEEQKAEILEACEALMVFYDKHLNINYPNASQYITSIDDVRYAEDLYTHYDPEIMGFVPEEEIEFWVTCAGNKYLSSSRNNEWCLVSKIDGEWTTYTEYMSNS